MNPKYYPTNRPTYRYKRKADDNHKGAITKIGGCMLLLMLLILFVAAHGRSNEMMYVTLLFVFVAIALFTYGYWSAVSRGEGIGQYRGKNNLQHQQVSSADHHFASAVPNYKGHPRSKVHVVAPPKMGGVKLEIYTLPDDCNTGSISGASDHSHHHHQHHHQHNNNSNNNQQQPRHHHHHHHKHHHEVHRMYHQHHQELMIRNSMVNFEDIEEQQQQKIKSLTKAEDVGGEDRNNLRRVNAVEGPSEVVVRPGQSCIELTAPTTTATMATSNIDDPIHCEVNLSRSVSQYYRQRPREDFAEVHLPPLKR